MPDTADALRQRALAYLAAHRVMTLATTGPEGVWAAAVFYVNDGFDLFFLSAGHTRHARQMAAEPQVAVTIQEAYTDWPDIKGIQCAGRVTQLEDAARTRAVDLYVARYPFLQAPPPPIAAAMNKVNWYRLRPELFYFIDNSRGFGHRDAIPMPASADLA